MPIITAPFSGLLRNAAVHNGQQGVWAQKARRSAQRAPFFTKVLQLPVASTWAAALVLAQCAA